MIISVKQKHIDKGIRNSPTQCPVALAVTDAGFDFVVVSIGQIRFVQIGENFKASPWTRSVDRFISKFDKTGKGKPFNFKLAV